ncbi:DsbA family protein [Undibacterium sp. Di26W]|uniref:DsbA family protein n=1 Tax=Undibacterium sp. Di26W TaxID=3413035 RepID=UPI003BF3AC43
MPIMPTILTYLFDPLCGWCYGASPVIQKLGQQSNLTLELAPTGLFAGSNGRAMDVAFAEYAWTNDVRIEKLTGQRFTEEYRAQVLGKHGSRFDSETVTLALTAVSMTEPQRELEALKVLQEARYVYAQDITATSVVEKLLRDMSLVAAAVRLATRDAELRQATDARIRRAQHLLQTYGITGVPNMVVTKGGESRLLRGDVLFGDIESLLDVLEK